MGGQPQKHSANENLGPSRDDYRHRLRDIRARSAALAAPLGAEDQCIQSMPDVSPTKWHLAHTSWFFETFLLKPFGGGYGEFHPGYDYLFNSYYDAVGPRHERPKRGLLSRPPLEDIHAYRRHVEDAMERLIDGADDKTWNKITPLIDLGLNHEQQHQELMLTDIKHVFSCNPLAPAYQAYKPPRTDHGIEDVTMSEWIEFSEGLIETGFDGPGFAFDNEGPRHKVWLNGFRIPSRPVTNAEFLEFIDGGGYGCPQWWLSEGWAAVQENGWEAPLYWQQDGEDWQIMTLAGMRALDPAEPVCHVSYFEADAYATALMVKSGLGAEPQARMLEKLIELVPEAATQETSWLASHPPVTERAEAIRQNAERWEETAH